MFIPRRRRLECALARNPSGRRIRGSQGELRAEPERDSGEDGRRAGDGEPAADTGRARRLRTTCPRSIVAAPTMPEDDSAPRIRLARPRLRLLSGTDRRGAPQPLPRRSGPATDSAVGFGVNDA